MNIEEYKLFLCC